MTWANIGVPSSDVPAEVELLHMRIEHHAKRPSTNIAVSRIPIDFVYTSWNHRLYFRFQVLSIWMSGIMSINVYISVRWIFHLKYKSIDNVLFCSVMWWYYTKLYFYNSEIHVLPFSTATNLDFNYTVPFRRISSYAFLKHLITYHLSPLYEMALNYCVI